MTAPIAERVKRAIVPVNDENAIGKTVILEPDAAARVFQFRNAVEIDDDRIPSDGPYRRILQKRRRRYPENPLKKIAFCAFLPHAGPPPDCSPLIGGSDWVSRALPPPFGA
jgi:hypothetical protein